MTCRLDLARREAGTKQRDQSGVACDSRDGEKDGDRKTKVKHSSNSRVVRKMSRNRKGSLSVGEIRGKKGGEKSMLAWTLKFVTGMCNVEGS